MGKTSLSSLKDLYGLFLEYKHLQLFYTNGTGCSISLMANTKEVKLKLSCIEELIVQSPFGCVILKDHYRSSSGTMIKQDISIVCNELDKKNIEVDIGSFHISFYLF